MEVSYVEHSSVTGVALACAESSDARMLECDLQAHAFGGRMWYSSPGHGAPMPAVAPVVQPDAILLEQLQQAQKHRFSRHAGRALCA